MIAGDGVPAAVHNAMHDAARNAVLCCACCCASDGRARLEGDLELSRAFGDLGYRAKGLVAVPEVAGPRALTPGEGLVGGPPV